jgi:hypothetical protein
VDCAFYDLVSSLGPAAVPQRCFWRAPVHREIETAEHYRAPSRCPENCRDASRKKNSRENEILAENLGSFATLGRGVGGRGVGGRGVCGRRPLEKKSVCAAYAANQTLGAERLAVGVARIRPLALSIAARGKHFEPDTRSALNGPAVTSPDTHIPAYDRIRVSSSRPSARGMQ